MTYHRSQIRRSTRRASARCAPAFIWLISPGRRRKRRAGTRARFAVFWHDLVAVSMFIVPSCGQCNVDQGQQRKNECLDETEEQFKTKEQNWK